MPACRPGHDDFHHCSWTPYLHCADCCRELNSFRAREKNARIRSETFAVYGRTCVCCGEAHDEFLCIDHVNGGGNAHRKITGGGGLATYYWLKREGWPSGYQTLCHNCNHAKAAFGICPHQKEAADAAATSA